MNKTLLLIKKPGQVVATVALTLSFSMNAYAASQAGSVALAAGQVRAVITGAEPRDLKRKDPVNNGDNLSTGDGSFAQIRFIDGGYVSLKENSELTVDEVTVSQAKGKDDSFVVSLSKGSVRAISGQIGRVNKSDYVFKTPLGSIGIRGTTFSVSSGQAPVTSKGPLDTTRPERESQPQTFADKVLKNNGLVDDINITGIRDVTPKQPGSPAPAPGANGQNTLPVVDVIQVTSGGIRLSLLTGGPAYDLECCNEDRPNSAILLGPPGGNGPVEVFLFKTDRTFWDVPLERNIPVPQPVEIDSDLPRLNSPGDNFGLKEEPPIIIDNNPPAPVVVDPVPDPAPAPGPDPVPVPEPAPPPVDPTVNQGIFDNIPTGQIGQGQGLQGTETPPDESNPDTFINNTPAPTPFTTAN